ncbi:hypothetical protein BDW62DRAFT_26097 [Aspergillus aurantiobrunneus]
MATRLPPKYVDIANALATRGVVNVMGVVVDVWGGVFKTQGTSVCITFTIKDCNLDNGHTWDGLKVRYFKEMETMLPPVREGDVVLLRGLYVKVIESAPQGVASQARDIPWAIFRPDRDPTSPLSALTGPLPFEPTYQEKTCASSLLEATPTSLHSAAVFKPDFAQISASGSTSTTQQKFSLLKDIAGRQFVDLIGEICKIHHNDSEKATLYLTDYTENDDLFCYASDNDDGPSYGREGDEYGYIKPTKKRWNGPSGRMTIQITLWEPHASSLRSMFSETEIVRLKNVRMKKSRVEGGPLEGVIHTNRDNQYTANVFPVDLGNDPRVQQLLLRKEEYWKAHPKSQKRKSDEDAEPSSKKSNTKKKKVKTKQQKESGQTTLGINKRSVVNENIKPRVPASVPSQPLEDIISNPSHNNPSPSGIEYRLPFQNLCYLTTVRVVDFYPPLLEDFAVLQEHASLAYNEQRDPATSRTISKWEWRFCLLVESISPATSRQPKERVKLFVSNSEAEHLLNMVAKNLRQSSGKLNQLREKLFLLWGDLEERKKKAMEDGKNPLDLGPVSSVPFNCCIMEYGIRCRHSRDLNADTDESLPQAGCPDQDCFGWERRFGLLKTTIHG